MLLKFGGGNADRILVGYDLGDTSCQISYCRYQEGSSVETVSSVAGAEYFVIPAALCKKAGANQWLFGREAVRFAQENPGEGILVDRLLHMALDGELVQLEGQSYQPISLLTLFVKRSLGMLGTVAPPEKVAVVMFTCRELDARTVEVLDQVTAGLQMKNTEFFYQRHSESFYSYMLYQPRELWTHQSVLFEGGGGEIRCMRMEYNKRTTPIVTYIREKSFPFPGGDQAFLEIAQRACENRILSSVYLVGETFGGDWMKESLRYLCRGRRVFQGSNLFSRGACCSLLEKYFGSEAGRGYVFLGGDKLKANIGMRVIRRGDESYFALLDAGNNWYEAKGSCEFYLQEDNVVELAITPLIGGTPRYVEIPLEGLALGEGEMTRLRMGLYLSQEERLCVEIVDLGFGQFRSPVREHWKKEIEIYG